MKKYFLKVAEIMKNKKYPKMYEILEKVMLEEKYPSNVDYPCGPTYHLMGIDTISLQYFCNGKDYWLVSTYNGTTCCEQAN